MFEPKPYLRSVQIKTDLQPDWSVYPFAVPAVNDIEQISFHPDVTFFVGENGAGKSTILEAIALALGFSEEGGTLNVRLNSMCCLNSRLTSVLPSTNCSKISRLEESI